jgi:hypothetical protein
MTGVMNRDPITVPSTSVPRTPNQTPSSLGDGPLSPSPGDRNRLRVPGSRRPNWIVPAALAVLGLLLAIWAYSAFRDRDQNLDRGMDRDLRDPGAVPAPPAAPRRSNP